MRFLVLGAGSLGSYYGAMLLEGGADVTFLARGRRAAQLAEQGLVIKLPDAEIRRPARTVLAADGTYDGILLACKTYDLPVAMEAIAPAIGTGTAILPVLNGIDHIAVLAERLGRSHVLGGVGAVAAALSPDGEVARLPGPPGGIMFGELDGALSPRCAAIHAAFAKGGVPSTVSPDIMAEMWLKLFLFASIAAVATLTRALAGAIAASASGAPLVAASIEECARIIAAEGHLPSEALRDAIRRTFADPASNYAPSILRDFERGRRTEADATLGLMVRRAAAHGLPAPILTAALCNLEVHAPGNQP